MGEPDELTSKRFIKITVNGFRAIASINARLGRAEQQKGQRATVERAGPFLVSLR